MVLLFVGLLVVTHYGESVDEPLRIDYAEVSINAYRNQIENPQGEEGENLQDEKGPFYGMLAYEASRVLLLFFGSWSSIDGWHYMSFVAFVIGVFFFYRLCRRIADPPPALAATLLFASQPVLWGHAFINPKDIPFMAFFLGSVCLGLEMVDHWQARRLASGQPSIRGDRLDGLRQLRAEWGSASKGLKRWLAGLGLFLVVLVCGFPFMRSWIVWPVSQAYYAPSTSTLGRLFHRVAQNASQAPLQAYIHKAQILFDWLILALGVALLLGLAWTLIRVFPSLEALSFQSRLLLAACFLGFASDIRTLGPASGMLVGVYFLYKGGRKTIPYLLEYLASGALIIYVFWPYLWNNPLGHYLSSLHEATDFPWEGHVFFAGVRYASGQQPITYLPVLFGLQFTETALILIVAGILLACFCLVTKASLRMDMLLAGAWLILPMAAAILLHSIFYNNFRQFLFVIPILFFCASLTLQVIWKALQGRQWMFIPLVLLILLPGLYWDWQLHPYQYLYYNSLAGGEDQAAENYDMDYWFTSYKECMQYINQIAPEGSLVYSFKTTNTSASYARSDLTVTSIQNPQHLTQMQTFYAIVPSHFYGSTFVYAKSKVIYQIKRAGVVLAEVKEVNKRDLK
jgi:hypothetical protein